MEYLENIPYEDFHAMYYRVYLANTTEEGKKQLEAEQLQDQMEALASMTVPPSSNNGNVNNSRPPIRRS